jgi:hypothetical protein
VCRVWRRQSRRDSAASRVTPVVVVSASRDEECRADRCRARLRAMPSAVLGIGEAELRSAARAAPLRALRAHARAHRHPRAVPLQLRQAAPARQLSATEMTSDSPRAPPALIAWERVVSVPPAAAARAAPLQRAAELDARRRGGRRRARPVSERLRPGRAAIAHRRRQRARDCRLKQREHRVRAGGPRFRILAARRRLPMSQDAPAEYVDRCRCPRPPGVPRAVPQHNRSHGPCAAVRLGKAWRSKQPATPAPATCGADEARPESTVNELAVRFWVRIA